MFLYVFLDAFVAIGFFYLGWVCLNPRWKTLYGLLALTSVCWCLTNLLSGLMFLDLVPLVEEGTALDILWLAPYSLLVLAARLRTFKFDEAAEEPGRKPPSVRAPRLEFGGPLLVYLAAIPIIHIGFYSAELLDTANQFAREMCVLAAVLILGGLALANQKRDQRERELLEEQFRQSQKLEAIGRLAGGVAHDFNNLMTVIHGYSSMALESLAPTDRVRADIQEIVRAGDKATRLTESIAGF